MFAHLMSLHSEDILSLLMQLYASLPRKTGSLTSEQAYAAAGSNQDNHVDGTTQSRVLDDKLLAIHQEQTLGRPNNFFYIHLSL